jgi:hypothetical protein
MLQDKQIILTLSLNIKFICTWHKTGEKIAESLTFLPFPNQQANTFYFQRQGISLCQTHFDKIAQTAF